MILRQYKALFVHVPKAAGQSVEDYFLNQLGKSRTKDGSEFLMRFNDDPTKGPERLAHLTAEDYTRYNYLSQEDFNSYYKFSIVRDPWSRMVSFYKFQGYSSLVSFEKFVSHYVPLCMDSMHWFFRPQADFIYNDKDELLVDYVGKLERLNEDFKEVAKKLKLEFDKLPRNNHSKERGFVSRKSWNLIKEHPSILGHVSFQKNENKGYRDAYNDKTIALVGKYYERDIDLLKYAF